MEVISMFFNLLNDIFLKMTWLSNLIEWIVNNIFRLPINNQDILGKIGGSLHFFICDTIKIIALLSILIFIFSYIEIKFIPEKIKRFLSKLKGIKGGFLYVIVVFFTCNFWWFVDRKFKIRKIHSRIYF